MEKSESTKKPYSSSLTIDEKKERIYRIKVFLDRGASHNVYYGPKIPEGALKRDIELAHGTKVGYVKGGDITFLDASVPEEQAEIPSIISLGRLIQKGSKLEWNKDGALMVLPNKRVVIPVQNNFPYANEEVLKL